jgi:SAM-dependent methyltransferase
VEHRSDVEEGHYERKIGSCPSRLIAWSHRRRFASSVRLASRFAGKEILDYGCGDGTFLKLLMESGRRPARALGAELSPELVEDCRRRLGGVEGLDFVISSLLENGSYDGAFDGVVCMEVLEHVLQPDRLLDLFARMLRPGGELLLSVPVETGLPVVVKQAARRVAGWRGSRDYAGTSSYTWRELSAAVLAGGSQHIRRPVYGEPGAQWHDHKGFNWMLLRKQLAERFDIQSIETSPLTWLSPHLASQVWFIARTRGREASGL